MPAAVAPRQGPWEYCDEMEARNENIARQRRTYEALNRGDFDAAIEVVHPDIEFVATDGLTTFRGAEKLRAWLEPDAIEPESYEAEEFMVTDDKVLVLQHIRGRGVASGIEIDMRTWAVWTLDEEGLATRIVVYLQKDEAKARQAAGMAE
jgi:ketosteroid isomerase-like protein